MAEQFGLIHGTSHLYLAVHTHSQVWASDANYCHETVDVCNPEVVTINIDNDNRIPIVQVSEPLPMESVRASEETIISGVARDNDGQVTRVEISVIDLASGTEQWS